MVYKDGTNAKVEQMKAKLGITGDVYIVGEGNYIENLEGHKVLIPGSTATTIEEAEVERLAYIEEEKARQAELAALAAEEGKEGEADGTDDVIN